MNRTNGHKKFKFNEKIDENWLHSLYEDDYAYIAEVFNSGIESFARTCRRLPPPLNRPTSRLSKDRPIS